MDLLKLDVEGDELGALQGLGPGDWPRIRQIVVEVCDVANCDNDAGQCSSSGGSSSTSGLSGLVPPSRRGRLAEVVALLEAHGFDVTVERQGSTVSNVSPGEESGDEGSYLHFTPEAARLYYVYAKRRGKQAPGPRALPFDFC